MANRERSNIEIAADVMKVHDRKILNKIDGILLGELMEEKLEDIMKDKQFPNKTKKDIIRFFETHNSPADEKIALIEALQFGMIKKVSPGLHTIQSLLDRRYAPVGKSQLFIDLCETLGNMKDSKETQGSTGTGAGEVLLCMLTKDGYLPTSKGDINIFGKGMEVKSSSGRIAAFDSVDQKFVKQKLVKSFGEELPAKGLKELLAILKDKQNPRAQEFLIDFFESRTKDRAYPKVLKSVISKFKFSSISPKEVQTAMGKAFISLYQKEEGWNGIILFKESKNFAKTNITIAFNEREFENLINFSGLGMTNGNQPVYLVASSK